MKIDFEKMGGLVPAIVQDNVTGKVLMLGFMNKEAYDITVTTKTAAKFTPSTGTYAYVYTVTAPSGTGTPVTTAVKLTGAEAPSDFTTAYYTDEACEHLCVAGDYTDGKTYYQKYTKNNGVYAVKVIKVIA